MRNLIFLLLLLPVFASAQIVKGSGIEYTNGAPVHPVNINFDAEVAIDSTTGLWYEYGHDCLCWLPSGFRVQELSGCSAPAGAPQDKQSEVMLNDCDSLYRWTGSVWHHLNKVYVYTGGTGISVAGTVISNTGDLSITNEGILGVAAGSGTTSIIISNTSGATGVTISQGTGIAVTESTSTNGGTITITNSAPDQTVSISGTGITVGGSYPSFTLTAADVSATNELQTFVNSSTSTTHTVTLSNSGGSIQLAEGTGITLTTTGTGLDGVVTIASTATGITDLTFSGSSSPVTLNSSTGTDVTFTAGGIVSLSATSGNITITATEVDGSTSNELQTYAHSGTTTYTNTLSSGGGSWSITGAGIAVISQTAGAITVTATEVDGSTTNEGSLTVAAGSGTTSLIHSNTSGSTDVTIAASTGLTISESGNTITLVNSAPDQTVSLTGAGISVVSGTYPSFTITSTEVDGSVSNEGSLTVAAGGSNDSQIHSSTSGSTDVVIAGGSNITVTESGSTITIAGSASGITSLNGLTGLTQTFATGTSGSDFGISSSGTVHTFNLPDASASNRGALTSTNFNTFNNKVGGTVTVGFLPKSSVTGPPSTLVNSKVFETTNTVSVGASTGIDAFTRFYVFGGAQGANIDVRGSAGAATDQSIIELQGADYSTSFKSIWLEYQGTDAVGTTMGLANANLGQLTFADPSNVLIRTLTSVPIRLAIGGTEIGQVTSNGLETRGAKAFRMNDSDNTNWIAFVPPSTGTLTANYTLTWPGTDGTGTQYLATDGSGVLSWNTLVTGNGIYGGSGSLPAGGSTVTEGSNSLKFVTNTTSGVVRDMIRLTTPYSSDDAFTNYLACIAPLDSFHLYSFDGATFLQSYSGNLNVVSDEILNLSADSINMATVAAVSAITNVMGITAGGTPKKMAGTSNGQALVWNSGKWAPGIVSKSPALDVTTTTESGSITSLLTTSTPKNSVVRDAQGMEAITDSAGQSRVIAANYGDVAFFTSNDRASHNIRGELGKITKPYSNSWDTAFADISTRLATSPSRTGLVYLPGTYTWGGTGSTGSKTITKTGNNYSIYAYPGTNITLSGFLLNYDSVKTGSFSFVSDGTFTMNASTNDYNTTYPTAHTAYFKIRNLVLSSGTFSQSFRIGSKNFTLISDNLTGSSSINGLAQSIGYSGSSPNYTPLIGLTHTMQIGTVATASTSIFQLYSLPPRLYDSDFSIVADVVKSSAGNSVCVTPFYFANGNTETREYRRSKFNAYVRECLGAGTSPNPIYNMVQANGATIDSCDVTIRGDIVRSDHTVMFMNSTCKGTTFTIDMANAEVKVGVLRITGGTYDSCTFIIKGNFTTRGAPCISISGGTFTNGTKIILEGTFRTIDTFPVLKITGGTIPDETVIIRDCRFLSDYQYVITSTLSAKILAPGFSANKPVNSTTVLVTYETAYVEGCACATVDLDANTGVVKDKNGNNISFTLPTDLGRFFIVKNGIIMAETGTATTRDYTVNTATQVVSFNPSLVSGDRVLVKKL